MYINRFDSHTHSDNSPDAYHSVVCLCEKAVEKGLMGLSITDHCECQSYEEYDYFARIQQSVFDIQRAKAIFGDKLIISIGMELGQALQGVDHANEVLEKITDFDFILGSLHNIAGTPDFYYLDYNDPNLRIHELVTQYYIELNDLAKWNQFDSLGHLTYPIRYVWGKARIPMHMEDYQEYIDEVMRTIIANGKGIEINTSGLRQGLGYTLPSLKYLKRYKELGGEIVTIGSDSHYAEHIGSGIEVGMDILKEAGFKYFAFYRERKPKMLSII